MPLAVIFALAAVSATPQDCPAGHAPAPTTAAPVAGCLPPRRAANDLITNLNVADAPSKDKRASGDDELSSKKDKSKALELAMAMSGGGMGGSDSDAVDDAHYRSADKIGDIASNPADDK